MIGIGPNLAYRPTATAWSSGADLDFMFATDASVNPRAGRAQLQCTRAGDTATVFNRNGVLETVPANTPRIDFDPVTLACRGLLVEEARTNYIRNNTMQGAALGTPGTSPTGWSLLTSSNGISRSITGTGQEDGIDYIDVRFFGVPTAGFTAYQSVGGMVSAAAGQIWAASAFFRLVDGSVAGAALRYRVSPRNGLGSILAQGAYATLAPSAEKLSHQRASAVATFPENPDIANSTIELIIDFTNGAPIDFTIRIGLPQLEPGAFATSPIKTSGAAVTRNVDAIEAASFSAWGNQNEGTILAEFDGFNHPPPVGVWPYVCALTTSSNSQTVQIALSSSGGVFGEVKNSGATQYARSVPYDGAVSTVALAYKQDDSMFSKDGDIGSADTSVSLPAGLDRMLIGSLTRAGASPLNGHIRRFAYWRTRLSNADLQQLTT